MLLLAYHIFLLTLANDIILSTSISQQYVRVEGVQTRRQSCDALPLRHVFHADAALLQGAAAVASLLGKHGHLLHGKAPAGTFVRDWFICFIKKMGTEKHSVRFRKTFGSVQKNNGFVSYIYSI